MNDILDRLPHRYPFLMVDKILEVHPGKDITVIKNVSHNEPHFQGHFSKMPVMPGVLITEALTQSGALLASYSLDQPPEDCIFMILTMDKIRFRKIVVPGDQLKLHVSSMLQRIKVWQFQGQAYVEGDIVAEATWTGLIAPKCGDY